MPLSLVRTLAGTVMSHLKRVDAHCQLLRIMGVTTREWSCYDQTEVLDMLANDEPTNSRRTRLVAELAGLPKADVLFLVIKRP